MSKYCLHGLCGRRQAEREGPAGRGLGWGTDSEGLLSSIILVFFSPPFPTFFTPPSLSPLDRFLHPSSCAVHSSSRDSVLMSLGTPPVLDRARMVWLTAAISTAREMGSWCSLCAALSSWEREGRWEDQGPGSGDETASRNSKCVQFRRGHADQLTVR